MSILIFTIGGVVTLLLLGRWLDRRILRPLLVAEEVATQVAQGNLSTTVRRDRCRGRGRQPPAPGHRAPW